MNDQTTDVQEYSEAVSTEQRLFPYGFKVTLASLRQGQEYGSLEPNTTPSVDAQDLAPFQLWSSERHGKPQLLGLTWIGDRFVLSHFVGAVWLDEAQESIPLVVRSKLSTDALAVDPVAMYIEACHLGQISAGVFGCESEQNVIGGVDLPQTTLLQVAVFLSALVDFVRKDLRHGFVDVRSNLVGKVKGKIIVSETMRQNITKGRADRVVCQYHVIDIDTVPNQILRAALTLCIKYLGSRGAATHQYDLLHEWARICDSALTGVTDRRISPADFHAVHYAGFMARYKPLHRLAKMILRRLHTDGTGAVHDSEAFTVPFWLDMNALFEKYVEVRLAQAEVNYHAQKTISVTHGTLRLQCRPDFIIGNGFAVLDAKYKAILDHRIDDDGAEQGMRGPWTASTSEGSALPYLISKTIPSDYYQIIAYSLLITHGEFSPASVVCLVVPILSRDSNTNEMLRQGFAELAKNDPRAFQQWARKRCPYFKLPLLSENVETVDPQESRTLLVAVLPCFLPTVPGRD